MTAGGDAAPLFSRARAPTEVNDIGPETGAVPPASGRRERK